MTNAFTKFLVLIGCLVFSPSVYAWGRHDLITQISLNSPEFTLLKTVPVKPESIESAAPDLLKRVIPDLEKWCERYHREYDQRYSWKIPISKPNLNDREALLWALENNMSTPLDIGHEKTAADILIHYVDEPDGPLDSGLNQAPYVGRLAESMSFFRASDSNTHAFRHYYVPTSLLPPIVSPKGIAPYRAALYARLSEGAFNTGHPYWGYRFLAWSMHYVQDVTQPWHTIFLPNVSFLQFSKEKMKHQVSALHYLTEAFADAWMERMKRGQMTVTTEASPSDQSNSSPWFVANLSEELARSAHRSASLVANLARAFFSPIVSKLNTDLKPDTPMIPMGGIQFTSSMLDFSGNGSGATAFLSPMWHEDFSLKSPRDCLLKELVVQINNAISGSRRLISYVLGNAHSETLGKPHLSVIEGESVSFPS